MDIKTYSELIEFPDFISRYEYLKLDGVVGEETFGQDRYLNQLFYNLYEWKQVRRNVIVRDNGKDLACEDRAIGGIIIVHHINPLTAEQIYNRDPMVFDMDNLICVSLNTHNAIHYGDKHLLCLGPTIRLPNDTCPWRNVRR